MLVLKENEMFFTASTSKLVPEQKTDYKFTKLEVLQFVTKVIQFLAADSNFKAEKLIVFFRTRSKTQLINSTFKILQDYYVTKRRTVASPRLFKVQFGEKNFNTTAQKIYSITPIY